LFAIHSPKDSDLSGLAIGIQRHSRLTTSPAGGKEVLTFLRESFFLIAREVLVGQVSRREDAHDKPENADEIHCWHYTPGWFSIETAVMVMGILGLLGG
jgi:hypothetical protein